MKHKLLFVTVLLFLSLYKLNAQCTFINPTVELNYVQQPDGNGNCIINLNLGFEIDVNNGNKIIFVHFWRTQDYTNFAYGNQNQPKESNVLASALATIILDNNQVNNDPNSPPSAVFKTTYGPDPGIDDNTGPAQHQVLDASDGLTYNRVVVDAANDIYRYTINNIRFVLPGACSDQISLTGDAWASNGNNSNPSVQCTMQAYSYIVNDPTISSLMFCRSGSTPNRYAVNISTTNTQNLEFVYDVFVDNGDDFFDQSLDVQVVNGDGPHTITDGSPYASGQLTYPAPYSTTAPWVQRNLWIRVRNMKLINNTVNPPVVINITNLLLDKAVNPTCIGLPVVFKNFNAQMLPDCKGINLKWTTSSEQNSQQFIIERSSNGTTWQAIGTVAAAGNSDIEKNYSYTDGGVSSGTWQYRLRQQDLDGREKLSWIVSVKLSCGKPIYYVYPNPVSDRLTIQTPGGNVRQLKVYNAMGQQMMQLALHPNTVQTITTSGWTKGLYEVVIMEDGQQVHSQKVVKH